MMDADYFERVKNKTKAQRAILSQLGESRVSMLLSAEDAEIIFNLKSWPYNLLDQERRCPSEIYKEREARIMSDLDERDYWAFWGLTDDEICGG